MGPVFAEPPRQVIGVVGNTRDGGLNQDPGADHVCPGLADARQGHGLNSRIAPWSGSCARAWSLTALDRLTNAIRESYRRLLVAHIRSMDDLVVLTTSRERFNMLLLSVFGSSALADGGDRHLWFHGLFGTTTQQELGICMALGAQAPAIRNWWYARE